VIAGKASGKGAKIGGISAFSRAKEGKGGREGDFPGVIGDIL
jgi:hypothetical protein